MAKQPLVGIIMGSTSDWETLSHAAKILEDFGIPFEKKVAAHRAAQTDKVLAAKL
jgi:5-(carboxyamino)imidazole ribonucleotide mutase